MGIEALVDAVGMVREGRAPRVPQDESLATYEEPCEAEHARIDFSRPARLVYNHIRGCDPAPGAYATLAGEPLRLFDAGLIEGKSDAPPGTVTAVAEGRAEVALIGGTLRVGRVQREGAAKVAAADVLNEGDALASG
jgi:methionyl-tRNA formyltransferase